MTRMLGPGTHSCPYGRGCSCNEAPGKGRRILVRIAKRRERQQVAREIRSERVSRAGRAPEDA